MPPASGTAVFGGATDVTTDASSFGSTRVMKMNSKKPSTSRDSAATPYTATPAASLESIDHLPLPALHDDTDGTLAHVPLDEIVGSLGDDLAFLPNVYGMFGVDESLGVNESLFPADAMGTRTYGSDAPSNQHELFQGMLSGEKDNLDCDKEEADGEESDEKKRARLVRNRESAALSRQRKKQYVDDLERKYRHVRGANAELQGLVGRLFAECEGLRHHLSVASGKPPTQRGVILDHPPPHGIAVTAPKMAIPRIATAGVPAAGSVPYEQTGSRTISNVAPVDRSITPPAAPSSSLGSAPGSPERVATTQNQKRRRTAPQGGALAAAATSALAVLSVVCVAFERKNTSGASSSAIAQWNSGGANSQNENTQRRRLLALEGEVLPMSSAERVTLPGTVGDALDGYDGGWQETPWEGKDTLWEGQYDPYETQNNKDTSFAKPHAGSGDPWFAAFHSAGLFRAEEFRRVVCTEMFQFSPSVVSGPGGDGHGNEGSAVVSSDAYVQKLRSEIDLDEAGDEDVADAPRPGTYEVPKLLPVSIPMPATERETSSYHMSSPSGLPAPPPRVTMGSITSVGDDSSLVSVLLPPSAKKTSTRSKSGFESLSKIFVVTYSRKREDYMTYSCRLPAM